MKAATRPPEHEAAMDWAADLLRRLSSLDRAGLLEAWNGPDGRKHREQMKATCQDGLRQLVGHVRERLDQLPGPTEA